MCGVSDDRCIGFSFVRWLSGGCMAGLLVVWFVPLLWSFFPMPGLGCFLRFTLCAVSCVQVPAVTCVPFYARSGHLGQILALFRFGMLHGCASGCGLAHALRAFVALAMCVPWDIFPGRCLVVCFFSVHHSVHFVFQRVDVGALRMASRHGVKLRWTAVMTPNSDSRHANQHIVLMHLSMSNCVHNHAKLVTTLSSVCCTCGVWC